MRFWDRTRWPRERVKNEALAAVDLSIYKMGINREPEKGTEKMLGKLR